VGRQVVKSYPSVAIMMGGRTGTDYSWVEFFLGWWFLLFCQEWQDHIWYGVLGSRVVSHWRQLVVSRFLGHNQWPTMPGVQDPVSSLGAFR
jgi:hypothetical protein